MGTKGDQTDFIPHWENFLERPLSHQKNVCKFRLRLFYHILFSFFAMPPAVHLQECFFFHSLIVVFQVYAPFISHSAQFIQKHL